MIHLTFHPITNVNGPIPFSHREKVAKGRMRGTGGRGVALPCVRLTPCTPHPSLRDTFSPWEKEDRSNHHG
jgi:hypothetical protein